MAKANIAAVVRELITPTVVELGYEVWDVEFAKEGADWHLCVTIDSKKGIDILDCEAVHRAIDPILDEAYPIEVPYCLDVSSPGIERDLRTDAHLLASIGQRCEVRLFTAIDEKKVLRGELSAFDSNTIVLACEDGNISLPRSGISKIRTVYFD